MARNGRGGRGAGRREGRFAAALTAAITDPLVQRLGPAGTADQVLDSTPALGDLRYPKAVRSVSGI